MPQTLSRLVTKADNASPRLLRSLVLSSAGLGLVGLGLAGLGLLMVDRRPANAGPLSCTTSLEAPITASRESSESLAIPASPVEVTRCVPVESVTQLMERRAYSWTAPYTPGVDPLHQATAILGIATGGGDGNRVMGFGFPDQTLIWDGNAIHNTAYALLDLQSNPMPLRTPDLVSVFTTSLGSGGRLAQPPNPTEGGMPEVYLNPPLLSPTQEDSRHRRW